MVKLLKYEFRGMRSYLFAFTGAVLLLLLTEITLGGEYKDLQTLATTPLFGFLAVVVTTFNNEIAKEREQLIFQTANSTYKILGAKLINVFIMVLLMSLVINICNVITGYVPFMGASGTLRMERLPELQKNIIRLFSIFWNSTIIVVLLALSNFVVVLKVAFFRVRWFGTAVVVVICIGLFYVFIWFTVTITNILPVYVVMESGIKLHFNNILSNGAIVPLSSSSFGISNPTTLASTFYEDDYRVVLGVCFIISNMVITAVFYPITAWILKRRVFA